MRREDDLRNAVYGLTQKEPQVQIQVKTPIKVE